MPIPFKSTRDIIIRTEKFDEAIQFYEAVMGLKRVSSRESLVAFETGGFLLYVERGAAHGPVFEFLVPDVAAAKRALMAAGSVLVEEDPALPRCYVRDPQGLVFNIGQRGGS